MRRGGGRRGAVGGIKCERGIFDGVFAFMEGSALVGCFFLGEKGEGRVYILHNSTARGNGWFCRLSIEE